MSQSSPLRIAEVAPQAGGCIGIIFAPGKKQVSAWSGRHDRDLAVDLDVIAAWGAAAIVSLIEAAELTALQIEGLGEEVRRRSMEWLHLPIPDVTAPDAEFDLVWPGHSARFHAILKSGGKILVHCKGGLGRAGTIAARLLVELGSRPADAIAAVRAVRPGAIQTKEKEHRVESGRSSDLASAPHMTIRNVASKA